MDDKNTKEPPLDDKNELLKPSLNPFIWLAFLLIPIVVLLVLSVFGEQGGETVAPESSVQQQQNQQSGPEAASDEKDPLEGKRTIIRRNF
jgi:hypothetical protein